jgi:chlorite dismutase
MQEHIRVGREYPSIDLNTSYSFGLDDQEFVVAFEGDEPAVFLDLVQRLRTTESSSYTRRDTPTFTCISMSVERALNALDGASVAVEA